MDARDLLRTALVQYKTSISILENALKYTETTLTAAVDEETVRQILELRALITHVSHESRGMSEACSALAETLEALANEVTVREEHVPAEVS
jgi:hypothetical protein